MRHVLPLMAVVFAVVVATMAQQSLSQTEIAALLTKLRSNSGGDRDAAFYQLRSDPAAMRRVDVRSALITLLDVENHEAEAGKHIGEGEGYGEYLSALLGSVETFADWNDQRQVCILVNAGTIPNSPTPAETAERMRAAVPCLLEMAKGTNRVIAVPLLVQAVGYAKEHLDSRVVETARQVVLQALRDPDAGVRFFTVDALGKFGGKDMIHALEQVAANDPSLEVEGHSIRKSATESIAAIQKRAQAAN